MIHSVFLGFGHFYIYFLSNLIQGMQLKKQNPIAHTVSTITPPNRILLNTDSKIR